MSSYGQGGARAAKASKSAKAAAPKVSDAQFSRALLATHTAHAEQGTGAASIRAVRAEVMQKTGMTREEFDRRLVAVRDGTAASGPKSLRAHLEPNEDLVGSSRLAHSGVTDRNGNQYHTMYLYRGQFGNTFLPGTARAGTAAAEARGKTVSGEAAAPATTRTRAPSPTARATELATALRTADAEAQRAATAPEDGQHFHRAYTARADAQQRLADYLDSLTPAQRTRAEAAVAKQQGKAALIRPGTDAAIRAEPKSAHHVEYGMQQVLGGWRIMGRPSGSVNWERIGGIRKTQESAQKALAKLAVPSTAPRTRRKAG